MKKVKKKSVKRKSVKKKSIRKNPADRLWAVTASNGFAKFYFTGDTVKMNDDVNKAALYSHRAQAYHIVKVLGKLPIRKDYTINVESISL